MKTAMKNILYPLHNTPIMQINKGITKEGAKVYVKLECYNEGGSIKSRTALNCVNWLQNNGLIVPFNEQELVVASGSNFASAIIIIAKRLGYKVTCAIPNNYSPIRIAKLRLMGANVILADSKLGPSCHIIVATDYSKNTGSFYVDQFVIPANPDVHFFFTGNEIVKELGNVDVFCSGVGTGGTITGIGRRLKHSSARTKVVAVQPQGASVMDGVLVSHRFQGISVFSNPPILDKSIIDSTFDVLFEECMALGHKLLNQQGLLLGLSSLANIYAAIELAKTLPSSAKVVTVAPDDGNAYLAEYQEFLNINKQLNNQ